MEKINYIHSYFFISLWDTEGPSLVLQSDDNNSLIAFAATSNAIISQHLELARANETTVCLY